MGTQHVTNDGPNTIYVGGKMIAPGEGRDIDERDLPPELRAAPVAADAVVPSLDEELEGLRAKPVKEIVLALPTLTHEALERLAALENEAKHPRSTLLTAIADEHIRRADDKLTSDTL